MRASQAPRVRSQFQNRRFACSRSMRHIFSLAAWRRIAEIASIGCRRLILPLAPRTISAPRTAMASAKVPSPGAQYTGSKIDRPCFRRMSHAFPTRGGRAAPKDLDRFPILFPTNSVRTKVLPPISEPQPLNERPAPKQEFTRFLPMRGPFCVEIEHRVVDFMDPQHCSQLVSPS